MDESYIVNQVNCTLVSIFVISGLKFLMCRDVGENLVRKIYQTHSILTSTFQRLSKYWLPDILLVYCLSSNSVH